MLNSPQYTSDLRGQVVLPQQCNDFNSTYSFPALLELLKPNSWPNYLPCAGSSGGEVTHNVKPILVQGSSLAFLDLHCPFAAGRASRILPLGLYALLEKVEVCALC